MCLAMLKSCDIMKQSADDIYIYICLCVCVCVYIYIVSVCTHENELIESPDQSAAAVEYTDYITAVR